MLPEATYLQQQRHQGQVVARAVQHPHQVAQVRHLRASREESIIHHHPSQF